MARQETTIREAMLDGGRGIGIVGKGDAVLPLPGACRTGNEFKGLHTFGPLARVIEIVQSGGEFDHGIALGKGIYGLG